MTSDTPPLVELQNVSTKDEEPEVRAERISKFFGHVIALKDVSMDLQAGEVMGVLGDNGSGKSTLIKVLSGVYQPDEGGFVLCGGERVRFHSPREARARGIATVHQDLGMLPLMSIWRNFFLGAEPTIGWGPFKMLDVKKASRIAREEMLKMGIDVRDTTQAVGTLSGGERQSVAISRAIYFGARVLILDEPTSALGVKQAGTVLRYILQARNRGLGVIFITHNPNHAYPVCDRFTILNRGRSMGTFTKAELPRERLVQMMAGGEELEELTAEIEASSEQTEVQRAIQDDPAAAGGANDQEGESAPS
ncbi:MAG: ATP-binding cassette domain-containing protein [Dehalococcoidia bacterium]